MDNLEFEVNLDDITAQLVTPESEIIVPDMENEIQEEKNKLAQAGGEAKNVEDMAEIFGSFSTSFSQSYYAGFINDFVDIAIKKSQLKKYQGFNNIFLSLYNILLRGYGEIDFVENEVELKTPELATEFRESKKAKGLFIDASRLVMKGLNNRMKWIMTQENTPEVLAKRNVIEHIFINWVKIVASTWQDKEMVDKCLKGFNHLGIEDE